MNTFFNYLLQTAIALAVFYMLYWFLLRKETFFRINRFYFLAASIFCMILPAINRAFLPVAHEIPAIRVIHDGYVYLNETFIIDPVTISQGKSILFSWHGVVLILYLTGVILLAVRLFYQTGFLIHEIRKYGVREISGMKAVVSKQIQSPFSFFSYIFLHPSQINESNLSNIIMHEKEHIKQRHGIDLFVVECLSVFQWFNPFVWFYRRSVKETHEFLADRAVIRQGIPLQNYQNLLLGFSMGQTYMGLVHTFNYSLSKKRMIMMKKSKSPNRRKWRVLFLIPVLVLLNLAFSNPFSGGSTFEDQKGSTESNLVKGKVTAEDTNKPLPGVNVIIKDTYTGTITDKNGDFSLEVKEENIMLSVSFIGYETLVIKAKKGEFLNIVLKRKTDKKELDYPEKEPVTQLSSIYAGLNIIDGKEVTKEEAVKLQQDPEHIQSISVLKGETAVEKYGEKGKNGAMIFTTKDHVATKSNMSYILTEGYLIKGKVIAEDTKTPLAGASIIIKDSHTGTITDLNGEFSLMVKQEGVGLYISYVGYKTIQVKSEKGKYLNLKLERETYRLELDYKEVKKIDDTPPPPVEPTKSFQDEKFVVVEDVPHFPGGNQALVEYISSNIKYPKDALKEGKSGKVLVTVRINEKGEVTNTRVTEAVHPLLDKEALRVISTMPDWKPGTQHGKYVSCDLILPIEFKLE